MLVRCLRCGDNRTKFGKSIVTRGFQYVADGEGIRSEREGIRFERERANECILSKSGVTIFITMPQTRVNKPRSPEIDLGEKNAKQASIEPQLNRKQQRAVKRRAKCPYTDLSLLGNNFDNPSDCVQVGFTLMG